ncbi:MAG TPA: response regulator [Chitinophagaceae bacterium]|jgi:CheY-like chemotaxis protein|nr:response regulator [Chitinophagaceae bacterium]
MEYKITSAGIIDDDQIYQIVMKKTIEQSGYVKSVLQFYDGEEAINFFREKSDAIEVLPELVLLDINMPYMDGWQFLDEFIKVPFKRDYKLTIFIVTSSSTTEDMNKAKEYSIVTGYYIKPITKDKFVEMMELIIKAA